MNRSFSVLGSPLLALLSHTEDRRTGRGRHQNAVADYRARLSDTSRAMAAALDHEVDARRRLSPDASDLIDRAVSLRPELWARRPGDADFLSVSLGWADQPSLATVRIGDGGDPELRREAETELGRWAVAKNVPVVVGLAVYLLLSRSGPLGAWGLLFTPQAMIIAQTILVAPIIAALTRQTIEDLAGEYRDELAAMDVGPLGRIATLIWDGRFSLVTALLAGFGRAAAEVGAVIIVGGNIEGFTRTMTTAIALETSKGDLPLAIGLGTVLIAIVVVVNAAAWGLRRAGERFAG